MYGNSKKAIIAKYTDKSRYKPEQIFGKVYIDAKRIEQSKKSNQAKTDYYRELKTAMRFSEHFNCDVFLLPEGNEKGETLYIEKHKNPDAIIHGHFIDFKQTKGTDTSVVTQFGRGIGQADGVLITIRGYISTRKAVQWINGKLNSMKQPHNGFIVVIENVEEEYGTYLVNGKRLSLKENLFTAAQGLSSPNKEG